MFQGDFSFVNVDASSLSTLPHRQRVTRHVHGYRRWKKGQDARRLLESSRFHEAFDPQLKSSKSVPSRATREDRPPDTAQAPTLSRSIRSLPSLLDVVLLNSSSEPSNVLSEQLAATTSSLLGFERECVVPAVRALELRMTAKENVPTQAPFTETWITESKAYLYDSIASHSYLSRIAATMHLVTTNPEHLDAAYQFRYKGVASLKDYMTTTPHISIPRLYRALLILLFADASLGDRQAFSQHVTVLKDIFATHQDEIFADPSLNLLQYINVIYLEVQFAAMNFSTTSVDLREDGWAEKQLLPMWKAVSPFFLTSRSEADRNLDSYLQGDIRTLFLDAQETLDVMIKIRRQTSLDISQTWVYAVSKIILTTGRLMNLYAHLDVPAILSQGIHVTTSSLILQKLEVASAILCVIYWLRELGGIENIKMTDHRRLFVWNPIMLSKLRHILTVYDAADLDMAGPQDNARRLPLALWVLWTGATAEHSASDPDSLTVENEGWFAERFSHVVRKAGIESMPQCQIILDRILQLHGMHTSAEDGWITSCFSQAEGP
ncbi:uncharacterized protein Z520_11192 [Fonsecaea multimorphosa CBS 102226]|uniref:Transcription factor domain-containing protein n=1 Tax=Fonsecaea multimorphosa CBS 102226 TaxID=1442371 RepID=A0A0D2GUD3_9EURO|nr:uncharacterized protein Z520_11192 [Fonsecaea multimorphosa CBS 102226]KIX93135.1 hypothetical protein Z520_11192 [Fonsecaea multimorphosa CBS 102226]OAL18336.1 hypothetical protein AYO22_10752 [Fonsecaea multimorphosa]